MFGRPESDTDIEEETITMNPVFDLLAPYTNRFVRVLSILLNHVPREIQKDIHKFFDRIPSFEYFSSIRCSSSKVSEKMTSSGEYMKPNYASFNNAIRLNPYLAINRNYKYMTQHIQNVLSLTKGTEEQPQKFYDVSLLSSRYLRIVSQEFVNYHPTANSSRDVEKLIKEHLQSLNYNLGYRLKGSRLVQRILKICIDFSISNTYSDIFMKAKELIYPILKNLVDKRYDYETFYSNNSNNVNDLKCVIYGGERSQISYPLFIHTLNFLLRYILMNIFKEKLFKNIKYIFKRSRLSYEEFLKDSFFADNFRTLNYVFLAKISNEMYELLKQDNYEFYGLRNVGDFQLDSTFSITGIKKLAENGRIVMDSRELEEKIDLLSCHVPLEESTEVNILVERIKEAFSSKSDLDKKLIKELSVKLIEKLKNLINVDKTCINICEELIGLLLKNWYPLLYGVIVQILELSFKTKCLITDWLIYSDDERKLNVEFVSALLKDGIVGYRELDLFVSKNLYTVFSLSASSTNPVSQNNISSKIEDLSIVGSSKKKKVPSLKDPKDTKEIDSKLRNLKEAREKEKLFQTSAQKKYLDFLLGLLSELPVYFFIQSVHKLEKLNDIKGKYSISTLIPVKVMNSIDELLTESKKFGLEDIDVSSFEREYLKSKYEKYGLSIINKNLTSKNSKVSGNRSIEFLREGIKSSMVSFLKGKDDVSKYSRLQFLIDTNYENDFLLEMVLERLHEDLTNNNYSFIDFYLFYFLNSSNLILFLEVVDLERCPVFVLCVLKILCCSVSNNSFVVQFPNRIQESYCYFSNNLTSSQCCYINSNISKEQNSELFACPCDFYKKESILNNNKERSKIEMDHKLFDKLNNSFLKCLNYANEDFSQLFITIYRWFSLLKYHLPKIFVKSSVIWNFHVSENLPQLKNLLLSVDLVSCGKCSCTNINKIRTSDLNHFTEKYLYKSISFKTVGGFDVRDVLTREDLHFLIREVPDLSSFNYLMRLMNDRYDEDVLVLALVNSLGVRKPRCFEVIIGLENEGGKLVDLLLKTRFDAGNSPFWVRNACKARGIC